MRWRLRNALILFYKSLVQNGLVIHGNESTRHNIFHCRKSIYFPSLGRNNSSEDLYCVTKVAISHMHIRLRAFPHIDSNFSAVSWASVWYCVNGTLLGWVGDWLDWVCLTTTHVLQDILAVLHRLMSLKSCFHSLKSCPIQVR